MLVGKVLEGLAVIWLAKLVVAWLLAIVAVPVFGDLLFGGRRSASAPSLDGVLGIGLLVGLPMLLFALVLALPLSLLVADNLPPLAAVLLYPFLIAAAAWLVSAPFPSGWKGVQQTIILFAFVMGVVWSLLNHFVPPSPPSV